MIEYNYEDVVFQLNNEQLTTHWIEEIIKNEKRKMGEISYIFCSNEKILEINKQYLNHDYYTDIITFDYCENKIISGDIFISIETVKENSLEYQVDFQEEINRVMAHGILHLCGYGDKTESEKKKMREKEEFYILKMKAY